MKRVLKPLSLLLTLCLLLCSVTLPVFASVDTNNDPMGSDSETEVVQEEQQTAPEIIVCANMGDWRELPENSIDAIRAAQAAYVSVNVQLSKDNVPMLLTDKTLDRMCVDKDGKTVHGSVADFTAKELQAMFLRNCAGGSNQLPTQIAVSKLEDAVSTILDKVLVVDVTVKQLKAVLSAVNKDTLRPRILLRVSGKPADAIDILAQEDTVPNTVLKYDGNVIFRVNSLIKKAAKSGLHTIQLGTKNHHGVIFYPSVTRRAQKQKLSLMFSMTDGYSGRRQDNLVGWDDVISRGYSLIETDDAEGLSAYVSRCEQARLALQQQIRSVSHYADGSYPKDLKYAYTKAVQQAKALCGSVASESQFAEASTNLTNACRALDQAGSTSTAASLFHLSAGRIITVVLCFAAVLAAQIFFFKRRKTGKTQA